MEVILHLLLIARRMRVWSAVAESPEIQQVKDLHQRVEEATRDADSSSHGERCVMLLELGYPGVLKRLVTVTAEIFSSQSASLSLKCMAANRKDFEVPGYMVIVPQVLVRIKAFTVLLNRLFLIEAADNG